MEGSYNYGGIGCGHGGHHDHGDGYGHDGADEFKTIH